MRFGAEQGVRLKLATRLQVNLLHARAANGVQDDLVGLAGRRRLLTQRKSARLEDARNQLGPPVETNDTYLATLKFPVNLRPPASG